MKILLDEQLPHPVRHMLIGHTVFTVARMHWDGIKNGSLLQLAADGGFDVLITNDRGLQYQQNIATLPCSVIILSAKSNALEEIAPYVPLLLQLLPTLPPRTLRVV